MFTKIVFSQTNKVHPLTCKAGQTDTSVAMNKVNASGIVQAGGGYALIYVDFTQGPCREMVFREINDLNL